MTAAPPLSLSPAQAPGVRALPWLLLLALAAGLLLPLSRLTEVWGTGHKGATGALTALFCRSYAKRPLRLDTLLPARWVDSEGRAREEYASQFVWPYLAVTAAARLTGASETALRLLFIALTLSGGALLIQLLRPRGPGVAAAGIFLYATSPLTLLYGDMGEIFLLMGIAALVATAGYHACAQGRLGFAALAIHGLPLALASSFLSPFFACACACAEWLRQGMGWRALRTALGVFLALLLPWLLLLALHLEIVAAATGSTDIFWARGAARGLWQALHEADIAKGLAKSWIERLGLPLLLLSLGAAATGVRSLWQMRRRGETAENEKKAGAESATAFAVLLAALAFTAAMLEMVARHDYALQLFLPCLAYIAAPLFVRLWTGAEGAKADVRLRKAGRILVVLLILTGIGLFAHRLARRSPPDAFERALARLSARAGERAGPGGAVLFVVGRNVMGAHTSVQYYSRVRVDRINRNETPTAEIRPYAAVLAVESVEWMKAFLLRHRLSESQMVEEEGILLWLRERRTSPQPGAEQHHHRPG